MGTTRVFIEAHEICIRFLIMADQFCCGQASGFSFSSAMMLTLSWVGVDSYLDVGFLRRRDELVAQVVVSQLHGFMQAS